MSMSGSATSSGQFFIGVAAGKFSLQNFSELSYVELETATISISAFDVRAGKWRVRTMLPAPTMPIRSLWLFLCIDSVRCRSCKLGWLLCELILTAGSDGRSTNHEAMLAPRSLHLAIDLTRRPPRASLRGLVGLILCQEFAILQDPNPCAAASFTAVVWPRKKAA